MFDFFTLSRLLHAHMSACGVVLNGPKGSSHRLSKDSSRNYKREWCYFEAYYLRSVVMHTTCGVLYLLAKSN